MANIKKNRIRTLLIKSIINWDEYISHAISARLRNPFLHKLMEWISNPPGWLWLFLLTIVFLSILGTDRTRKQIIVLLFSIMLSDQTCNLIKSTTKRVRPYGTDFSFPSSHAANMFNAAVLMATWLPSWGGLFYIWASLVAFSRVYLKKHYVLDVLIGVMIGVAYALIVLTLV